MLTRIDFINDFGTEASSTKGLELIASAACQEERLKQQFFKSFIDKKIVGAISEGGYIQKNIDGEFSYSAYACNVELLLEEQEKSYFLRQYTKLKYEDLKND